MNICLEIEKSFAIFSQTKIEDLNEKELVKNMLIRRRLTTNSKILIFLADKLGLKSERIIYGSNYGELRESISILNNIFLKLQPSPTDFQNSVYNTPSAYLSILSGNTSEILSVSNGDKTGENVLKIGAIKALDGDSLFLSVCESFCIEELQKLNICKAMCQSGVAFKVKVVNKKPNISFCEIKGDKRFVPSISKLISLHDIASKEKNFVVEVQC